MKIVSLTGVTKSNRLRVTKPIKSLLVATNNNSVEITNETITIFIERSSGNIDLCTKLPLKQFMLLTTFGNSAITPSVLNSTALCELSNHGALYFGENESLIIELDGLKPLKVYELFGLEEPQVSNIYNSFDQKIVLSDETEREFKVSNSDLMCVTDSSHIEKVQMTFVNGTMCTYEKEELKALQIDVDPMSQINTSGQTIFNDDHLILPVVGVTSVKFYKTLGTQLRVTLLTEKQY